MAPSPEAIRTLFDNLSDTNTQSEFFAHVADNVDWWIVGSTQMSGNYSSKQQFLDATIEILNGKVLNGPLGFGVVQVSGGGSGSDWATVEMQAIDAKCKNGMPYDMRYCWVVRFGKDDVIEQVKAYLDTELLSRAIRENQ